MAFEETAVITAQNQFTAWTPLATPKTTKFGLLISGMSGSVVVLQGSPDGGITVYDLDTFTSSEAGNTLHIGDVPNIGWVYRAGVKAGNYGGDVVTLRLEA